MITSTNPRDHSILIARGCMHLPVTLILELLKCKIDS